MGQLLALRSPAERALDAAGLPRVTLDEILSISLADARARTGMELRHERGLLGTNYKTGKAVPGRMVSIVGLSLAPESLSGVGKTLCAYSTPECRANCLGRYAGQNAADVPVALGAKIRRSRQLAKDPAAFLRILTHRIQLHARACERHGYIPAVRLNVYSDIPWEIMAPEWVQYVAGLVNLYDYTKIPGRSRIAARLGYDLTFSYSGPHSAAAAEREIQAGGRVAIVLATPSRKSEIPTSVGTIPVIDGDAHDARFLEGRGYVALRFKRLTARLESAAAASKFALRGPWTENGYQASAVASL